MSTVRSDDRTDRLDPITFAGVQVIRDTGAAWLVRVGGQQVAVPPLLVMAGSTVRWPTSRRGTLVIPRFLAVRLGLS